MFKKISSITVILALSAFCLSAQSNTGGVNVSKKSVNNFNGTYTINIEAFVTGQSVTTSGVVSQPVDAVLVLDVSGSMTGPLNPGDVEHPIKRTYKNKGQTVTEYYSVTSNTDINTVRNSAASQGKNVYVKSGDNYYLLQYKSSVGYYYLNDITPKGDLYIGGATRLDALKESVKRFVSTMKDMQDKYNYETKLPTEDPIQHRVSIVTFSGENYTNYHKVRLELKNGGLDMDKGANTLITAINTTIDNLSANGSTQADLGLNMGYNQLKNKRDGASGIMVFFTDGYPTGHSDFEPPVANKAIHWGYRIKNELGAKLYVVSVIRPEDDYALKFLDYLSSNYPDADSNYDDDIYDNDDIFDANKTGTAGSGYNTYTTYSQIFYRENLAGTPIQNGKFSMIVPNEQELINAFVSIAVESTSGGAVVDLTDETITADIVMADYQISKTLGYMNDIKAYVRDLEGIEGDDGYKWGDKKEDKRLEIKVEDDKTNGNHIVTVTGFNFGAHWCGFDYENGVKIGVHDGGQKLCLDINIIPNLDKEGGLKATNAPESGIYVKENGETGLGTQIATFGTPPVVYAPCDIVVKRNGLQPGESAFYTVTRYKGDVKDTGFERTVVVTADDNGLAEVILKGDVTYKDETTGKEELYYYEVKEDTSNWAWSYAPDNTVIKKKLYYQGDLNNVFEFTVSNRKNGIKDDDLKTFHEANINNKFKKLNTK